MRTTGSAERAPESLRGLKPGQLRERVVASPEPMLVVIDVLAVLGFRVESGRRHGYCEFGVMVVIDELDGNRPLAVVVRDATYRRRPKDTAMSLLLHVLSLRQQR